MSTKVTVREAALLTDKSRQTINDATKDGTLSFSKNAKGTKVIDIAELQRVYEIKKDLSDIDKKRGTKDLKGNSIKYYTLLIEQKLQSKEELLQEVLKQRDQLIQDKEKLQDQLDEALAIAKPITKLLEDQREGQGGRQKEFEEKLRKIEKDAEVKDELIQSFMRKEDERRIRAEKRRKQQEEEQGRGLWGKLFSKSASR